MVEIEGKGWGKGLEAFNNLVHMHEGQNLLLQNVAGKQHPNEIYDGIEVPLVSTQHLKPLVQHLTVYVDMASRITKQRVYLVLISWRDSLSRISTAEILSPGHYNYINLPTTLSEFSQR
jgi:hypothetical protein